MRAPPSAPNKAIPMRICVRSSVAIAAVSLAALPAVSGCLQHPVKPVEYDPTQVQQESIKVEVNKDVDILFVLDNSGTMAEEQANLAANFGSFIQVLEQDDVRALYRIGVTTSDTGVPSGGPSQICPAADTTPENGNLQIQPCTAHLDDFIFAPGTAVEVDARMAACQNVCPAATGTALAAGTIPTTTAGDDTPKSRPWIERLGYGSTDPNIPDTNLPGGIDTIAGFQCIGPQGINGCGFESQLEGMYQALTKATQNGNAAEGFLRERAILAIVQVTDEVDCSFNKSLSGVGALLSPNGSKNYWEDPSGSQATSSICWNAGVKCSPEKNTGGAPQQYTSCATQDWGLDGNETATPTDAVLYSMSKYTGLIDEIQDDKVAAGAGEVIVAVLAGVPIGYNGADVDVVYEDEDFSSTNDANNFTALEATSEQALFGIGKGCISGSKAMNNFQSAVPPVRLREFAEAYQGVDDNGNPVVNVFSICDSSYADALELVADRIRAAITPACYPKCAEDSDDATPGLQPECLVQQKVGSVTETVVACDAMGNVPSGEELCYVTFVREDQSGANTLSMECDDAGWNLEFDIVRATPAPGGAQITATCSVADVPAETCPELFD